MSAWFIAWVKVVGRFDRDRLRLAGVVALALLMGGSQLHGGQFQVRGWHVEDGLPDGSIAALAETTDGYLWIGTQKGLVRFDGAGFSRAGSDQESGLLDQRVSGLLAARDGSLWILSERGVVMHYAGGQFVTHFVPTAMAGVLTASQGASLDARQNPSQSQSWQSIGFLARDSADQVWALPDNATILRFKSSGESLPAPTNGLPEGRLLGICGDATGQIWLGKGANLCLFRDGVWTAFPMPDQILGDLLMCAGTKEGVWAATAVRGGEEKALFHRTLQGWVTPPAVTLAKVLSTILQDQQGRLWVSEWWGGVKVRQPDSSDPWQQVQDQGALAKCVVTCLFADHEGAVWAGTIGEGLYQVTQRKVEMVMLPNDPSPAAVTAVCNGERGTLWLGTGGKGIYRWENGSLTHFGLAEGLPSEDIGSVARDARGRIWTSAGAALAVYDGERFVHRPELGGTALALYPDHAGNLWFGQPSRLLCLREETNATAYYATDKRSLDIRGIAEDRAGRIWLAAFQSGVWQLQGTNLMPMNGPLGLSRSDVRSVYCDREGTLWIGTLFGGLFRWDGRALRHFLMVDGLPDDSIVGIAADEGGNLWISSGNGVFGCSTRQLADYERGRSAKLSCWQLGTAEGLANRGCSGGGQPVISRAPDGRFWVADMVGAAGFDPAGVTRQQSATNIIVEAVLADGVELGKTGSEFRVSTSARRFEFRYAAPELDSPKLLRFRCRLDELDRDWVDAGTARSVPYSKLPAGEYHFSVMVSGGDGIWHGNAGPLILRVVPHLWERPLLQALAVAALVGGMAGIVLLNHRRKLKLRLERLEMQSAVEKERARIARDIHDQIGASLTQISLMSELPPDELGDQRKVAVQLTRISGKSLSVVRTLNEIVWAVNPRNDNLPKLLDYLCSMSEELCDAAGIRCWHEVPNGLPPTPLKVEFRHNVALAVREALNNAIKHSSARAVWLRVIVDQNALRVEVEDDGSGFDPNENRNGHNGLDNIRTRIEQIGGRVDVTSERGRGTKVTLRAAFAAN